MRPRQSERAKCGGLQHTPTLLSSDLAIPSVAVELYSYWIIIVIVDIDIDTRSQTFIPHRC